MEVMHKEVMNKEMGVTNFKVASKTQQRKTVMIGGREAGSASDLH